jgi:hypothetical protein
MDAENLSWRSFIDVQGDKAEGFFGPIADRWNLAGTPTLYILDHKGVIRYRWLGGVSSETIDEALAKLIKEAEDAGKEPLTGPVNQARQSEVTTAIPHPGRTIDTSQANYRRPMNSEKRTPSRRDI